MSFRSSEDRFHEAARGATGLDDFGDDGYLEGLRSLLGALDDESSLSPIGVPAIEGMLLNPGECAPRLILPAAAEGDPISPESGMFGLVF